MRRMVTTSVILLAALAAATTGASPASAQDEHESSVLGSEVGGVRLSKARAGEAVAVVRDALRRIADEAGLRRAPSRHARADVLGRAYAESWPAGDGGRPDEFWTRERPMQVFVSLYNTRGSELSAEGRGASLMEALLDATAGLAGGIRYEAEGFNRLSYVRVAIDVTLFRVPYVQNIATPFLYNIAPGLDGLVYERGDQRGVVLPWEAVRRAWSLHFHERDSEQITETRPARSPEDVKRAMFRSMLERADAHPATWRSPDARVLKFRTQSFVEATPGGEVAELFRLGPLARSDEIVAADVAGIAARAADYLARIVDDGGNVRGAYDPLRGEVDQAFDPARQALAIQALVRLHEASGQQWALETARRARGPLAASLEEAPVESPDGATRDCVFPVADDRCTTAAIAQTLLATIALDRADPSPARRERAGGLANTLLATARPDGAFNAYFPLVTAEHLLEKDGEDLRGESLALLAMVRAWKLTGRQELMVASRRTADYLVYGREKRLGIEPRRGMADPYLVEALRALDAELLNDDYARYAAMCADRIVALQATDGTRFAADELGGFVGGDFPDTEYTGFCLRGLDAMVALADQVREQSEDRYRRLGLSAARSRAHSAIGRAWAFVLNLQYQPVSAFYVPDPAGALGGMRHSIADSRISTVAVGNLLMVTAD